MPAPFGSLVCVSGALATRAANIDRSRVGRSKRDIERRFPIDIGRHTCHHPRRLGVGVYRFLLRMPQELTVALVDAARAGGGSLNGEIVRRLERDAACAATETTHRGEA
jgi:hypothetical protein